MVLFFLSVFLLVKTVAELKNLPNIGRDIYPQSTVMVSGEGEAFAIPDIASFTFTVTEVADTVTVAQAALDQKVSKALEILEDADIEDLQKVSDIVPIVAENIISFFGQAHYLEVI